MHRTLKGTEVIKHAATTCRSVGCARPARMGCLTKGAAWTASCCSSAPGNSACSHQNVYPVRTLVASRRALIGEAGIGDPGRCDPAD